MRLGPSELLTRLSNDLSDALGAGLLGITVHGSYVAGDYHPDRSDLDLLAVLAVDPTPDTLATLARVHTELVRDEPGWNDHIEVDYVSPAAVSAVLDLRPPRPMVRTSPGEPLHLAEASPHYLLNWQAARMQGRALLSTPAVDLLPAIPDDRVLAVVRDHLRQWPEWVTEAITPGTQAYAVLTVCGAAGTLATGVQLSKRAAADYGRQRFPAWAPLIGWARDWWYDGGTDAEPDRAGEVRRFVGAVTASVLGPLSP